MKKINIGTVSDSEGYLITEQEKQIIVAVFSFFKDNICENMVESLEALQ